jgi:hypothetical protein
VIDGLSPRPVTHAREYRVLETALMAERYPAVEPYESGMLAVTDGHRMYWEMCGAPAGRTASSSCLTTRATEEAASPANPWAG